MNDTNSLAHTSWNCKYHMGDALHFSFKGNVAHVFSKETDKNLEF